MTKMELLLLHHKIQTRLLSMTQALDVALEKEGNVMVDPKVAALITEFDAATDKIAARIQSLIDAGGLSAESAAALQGEVDKLNTLGQDPANPIPAAA